jgi:hypothetical protein
VTALAAPAITSRYVPAASGGVDRAIRVSTAAVVLAVAGIAAYISYWHAYAVVREYGETGVTARLEPATIDGLVYASSMVILYAARHDRPVPRLARWMLALGILASLAVNVAQGWSHGLVGAVVAAWPAVSLVGSYELLAWIIRTAATGGPDHVPAADHYRPVADHAGTGPWTAPGPAADAGPVNRYGQVIGLERTTGGNSGFPVPAAVADPRTGAGPGVPDHPDHLVPAADHPDSVDQAADHADHLVPAADPPDSVDQAADHADHVPGSLPAPGASSGEIDTEAAAVAAYHVSVEAGQPLSERKLAARFGKTSRRWARNRMAEARQSPAAV